MFDFLSPQKEETPEQDAGQSSGGTGFDPLSIATGMLNPLGGFGLQGVIGNAGVIGMLPQIGTGGIGEALGGAGDWLGDKLGQAKDWAGEKLGQAGDWAGEKWEGAKQWAGEKWDGAKEWMSNKADSAKGWWDDFKGGVGKEGWTSVFDPVGTVDRQRASRELADRFSVVPDDFVGPRLPNQVTQEEYDKIVKNYSDIRLGRTDIDFNTDGLSEEDAAKYKSGAMNDLASIMQTSHGRDLIDKLAHNEKDHKTTLSPLFKKNAAGNYDASLGLDNTNGFASSEDASKANLKADGTANEGTNSRVRYNPGQSISPDGAIDAWLPFRSDVLLYHELVHSLDQTSGTLANGTDPATGEKLREQRASGLGIYSGETISENAYRRDRRLIAAGGTGARTGDDTMPDRTSYFYHTAPAAPAPGSAPGTPGTNPGVAHDWHDHHHDHDDD